MNPPNNPKEGGNPQPNQTNPLPSSIRLDYDATPLIHLTNAINQQANAQQVKNNTSNSVGNRQVNAQETGNRIARRGLIISSILGGFTIVAILISIKAVNEASRAADAAARADSLTQLALIRDSARYAESSYSDSIKFAKQLDVASRSLGTQIQSVKTTQSQFELENRPYIQISNIMLDSLGPNKPVVISFSVTNFGKQPVILKKLWTKLSFMQSPYYFSDSGLTEYNDLNDSYISGGGGHAQGRVYSIKTFTPYEYYAMATNLSHIFLIGKVAYFNPITHKNRIYWFDISPYITPVFGVRVIKNKDEELKGGK